MSELKTQPTRKSVKRYLENIEHPTRRADGLVLLDLMTEITQEKPVLWGDSIIGFGCYDYQQKGGQKGKWPLTGFSPCKQNLSVYVMSGFSSNQGLLAKLGKHKHSVGCLYINKLADVDMKILTKIIKDDIAIMRDRYL